MSPPPKRHHHHHHQIVVCFGRSTVLWNAAHRRASMNNYLAFWQYVLLISALAVDAPPVFATCTSRIFLVWIAERAERSDFAAAEAAGTPRSAATATAAGDESIGCPDDHHGRANHSAKRAGDLHIGGPPQNEGPRNCFTSLSKGRGGPTEQSCIFLDTGPGQGWYLVLSPEGSPPPPLHSRPPSPLTNPLPPPPLLFHLNSVT